MSKATNSDSIHLTRTVTAPASRAFEAFTVDLSTWWPAEYTWAKDTLETIAIEAEVGARCFERGPHGFECDWGRVLEYDPPRRLVFTWQISPSRVPEPNPDKASEVEVQFMEVGPSTTRVEFEHRGFARHGENGASYRDAMASPQGWPYILDQYVAAIEDQ